MGLRVVYGNWDCDGKRMKKLSSPLSNNADPDISIWGKVQGINCNGVTFDLACCARIRRTRNRYPAWATRRLQEHMRIYPRIEWPWIGVPLDAVGIDLARRADSRVGAVG